MAHTGVDDAVIGAHKVVISEIAGVPVGYCA
jgi:hypothetical protein